MANICDNNFYFKCETNGDYYLDKFKGLIPSKLSGFFTEFDYNENGYLCIEGYFESKWNFPVELFKEFLIDCEEDPDDCYFRCLSEEYGCGYVAMNIFEDGHWRDEQTFDL